MLHIGSLYWNVDGIKVLLDHGGSDLLLCADSIGRMPFHWAAAGPNPHNELTIPESEVAHELSKHLNCSWLPIPISSISRTRKER